MDLFKTTTTLLKPSDDLLYSKTVKSVSKIKDEFNLSNEKQKELHNNNLDDGHILQPSCQIKIEQVYIDENKTKELLKLNKASKIGNLSLENECEVIS